VFAPRAAIAWRPRDGLTVRGSVARAQRSPTLNERYRGLRVGDTQTLPNAQLDPERLTTWEAGAAWTRGRAAVRSTVFASRLADAITNVTVSTTPALTVRQRRNAGSIDVRGLEVEASARVGSRLYAELATAFVQSAFGDAAPPVLAGNRTPQSPLAQVAAELRWDDLPRVSAAIRALVIGEQYEDDLNTLVLRRAALVDVMLSRVLAPGWLAFVGVENVADQDYDVGRTPLRTVGSPRMIRAGVRWTWQ
jgi:outer membrane receptor protein involved in Fe transport